MMQTDVKSKHINASGVIYAGRTRLRGVMYTVGTGTPTNHVKFYNNNSAASGTILVELDANSSSSTYILIPSEGVLFDTGIYCDIGDARAVTVFYG